MFNTIGNRNTGDRVTGTAAASASASVSAPASVAAPEFGLKRPEQIKVAPPAGPRVPPGQFVAKTFPVLTYGDTPEIELAQWRFRVWGLVAQELTLDWEQFLALPQAALDADFHCVTQWSALDQSWEGVAVATLLAAAGPLPGAAHIMAHCYGGYTANLPLAVAQSEGLLAHRQNGAALGKAHGWPLRLVAPSRYGWKSAKWVNGIEVLAEDAPGFWEQRGYHNNGDPWQEERFWPELTR